MFTTFTTVDALGEPVRGLETCPAGHVWDNEPDCICEELEQDLERRLTAQRESLEQAPSGYRIHTHAACGGHFVYSHKQTCGDGFYACTRCGHTIGWETYWPTVTGDREPAIIADRLATVPRRCSGCGSQNALHFSVRVGDEIPARFTTCPNA